MKNLTIKSAFLILNVVFCVFVARAQGSIEGTITDVNTGENLPFATVSLKVGDDIIKSSTTNYEGYFVFENVAKGYYLILINYMGSSDLFTINVNNQDLTLQLDFEAITNLIEVDVFAPKPPKFVLTKENIEIIDAEFLDNSKLRNPKDVVAYVPTIVPTDEGLSIKGSRPGTAVYYIDGIRTYGELYMPMSAVDNIEVYTGGVPAKYGNTTAGVIVVETKSFIDFY